MELTTVNIDSERINSCYDEVKAQLSTKYTGNPNMTVQEILPYVLSDVEKRFKSGIYLCFQGYNQVNYSDSSNPLYTTIDGSGLSVLPNEDGWCRFGFDDTEKITVHLKNNNQDNYEKTFEGFGYYKYVDNQWITVNDFDIKDEIFRFNIEKCRLHLSKHYFNGEDYHDSNEVLSKLKENIGTTNDNLKPIPQDGVTTEDPKTIDNDEFKTNDNNDIKTMESKQDETKELTKIDNIIIYTQFSHLHIWDCDCGTTWPGISAKSKVNEWNEFVLNTPKCKFLGSFDSQGAGKNMEINEPGIYYYKGNEIRREEF